MHLHLVGIISSTFLSYPSIGTTVCELKLHSLVMMMAIVRYLWIVQTILISSLNHCFCLQDLSSLKKLMYPMQNVRMDTIRRKWCEFWLWIVQKKTLWSQMDQLLKTMHFLVCLLQQFCVLLLWSMDCLCWYVSSSIMQAFSFYVMWLPTLYLFL